jgi:hypothetical protein
MLFQHPPYAVATRGAPVALLLSVLLGCAGPHTPVPDYPPLASAKHEAAEEASEVSVSSVSVAFRFEANGTYTRTIRDTYKILTQDGIENWGGSEARWSPWHMERPTLRATVKAPDGSESRLEAAAVAEAAAYPEAPEMYGDERVLRAPLPNVRVGSVVNEEIITRTNRAFPSGAESFGTSFQVSVPREKVELVVDIPEQMPLKYAVRDAKVTVSDVRRGGRRTLTFTGGPYEAVKGLEASVPSNFVQWPHVSFTTGTEWKQVATTYAKVVADKTASANFEGVVAKVVSSADSPSQKADKLLAWMRDRVRYVGVEFGDSSVIPATPDETLRRGYGDCKDQAVLLVALLRAAGLPARVALLDAGFGEDIDPSLPALNAFDHAIAVLPGRSPLWMDPTATRARAGELPTPDQGRYALVADPDTDALTRTPEPSEKLNTYREVRQVFLPEYGGARIVETGSASGALERDLRDRFDASPADGAKWLKEYVSKTYSSKELGRMETSKVDDLSKPFSTVIEAKDAKVSTAELLTAKVDVNPSEILGWVPTVLSQGEERKSDLALQAPYQAELVYEIHPGAGFVADEKTDMSDVAMGPATLKRHIEERRDGVIVVRYQFALPRAVWKPGEVNDFRKAYAAFMEKPVPSLSLVHQGKKEHLARQFQRELEIYRRDVALRPQAAVPRMRLAQALLEMGFGTSARKLAAEAVGLAPDDSALWAYAGYIRSRDTLGRWHQPGWDLDGTIAAYREAVRADPSSVFAATNLAVMLEYSPDGKRYAAGSKLEDAIAAIEHIEPDRLAAYDNGDYVNNAVFDLLWLGRYDEVRSRVAKMDTKKAPWIPAIVAASMLGGPTAGLSEATRLSIPEASRPKTLESAADDLIKLRKYPEAAALLSAAAAGSSEANLRHRAEVLGKTKRLNALTLPVSKPQDVVARGLALCLARPPSYKDLFRALISKRADAPGRAVLDGFCEGFGSESVVGTVPREAMADVVHAAMELHTDGSDALGYRVNVGNGALFVVRDGGAYLLRGVAYGDLGCEALAMAKAGRNPAAVQWLTWARELITPASGDDALRDEPFLKFWTDKKDEVELSAATLCASGGHPDLTVSTLEAALAKESGERAASIEHAIAMAYSGASQYTELLAAARRLEKDVPTSSRAWHYESWALAKLGRFQELRDAAAARLAKDPNNADRLWDLASAEDRLGSFKEAQGVGERLIATNKGGSSAYNQQAWRSLFTTVTPKDLDYALKAVNASPNDAASLNTLAAVEAALGHLADAREHLLASIEKSSAKEPRDADWYVIGRIAEQLGLPDEAKAAYSKVSPGDKAAGQYTTARLTAARLRALK